MQRITTMALIVLIGALATVQAENQQPPGDKHIVGGEEVDWSDFPFVGKEGIGRCTASLIAPTWVLTAAYPLRPVP